MNSDFHIALSSRLDQLQRENSGEFDSESQLITESDNRKLFELAIRIYAQRLGADLYSAYYEVCSLQKVEFISYHFCLWF